MILISSSQALDMLEAHAPRAWAKRVLSWQIYIGEIDLYFTAGLIVENRHSFVLATEPGGENVSADRNSLIAQYGEEIVQNAEFAMPPGRVAVRIEKWENEARVFPVELIVYADELDWDTGTLSADLHEYARTWEHDFYYLSVEHETNSLQVGLEDMCFSLEAVEMLAPNGRAPRRDELPSPAPAPSEQGVRKGGPGRRREHDWDGALFHLIGEAEKNSIAPDPDAHGAQADIKRRLADWFASNGGKVPADSQLQVFAARVLNSIRQAKP